MDLEVACADRRLHPVPVAARARPAPVRLPTRWRRRSGARAVRRRRARASSVAHRLRLERARPEPPAAPRRAGQHDDDAVAERQHEAGRGAREPERDAPSGQRRLLASPRLRSPRTGACSRSATAARDAPRSRARASSSTTSATPAAAASSSTVRSSCVGPSPPETTQRSARRPSPQRVLELVGPVADDRDPAPARGRARAALARGRVRSDPVRSPRTSSLPVTTIAARGRSRRSERQATVEVICCGVTDDRPRAEAVERERLPPFSESTRCSGSPTFSQSDLLRRSVWRLAALERAVVEEPSARPRLSRAPRSASCPSPPGRRSARARRAGASRCAAPPAAGGTGRVGASCLAAAELPGGDHERGHDARWRPA